MNVFVEEDNNLKVENEEDEVIEEYMLTTVDNPYNPFTQFDLWRSYDEGCGYYTLSYLARVAKTSPYLETLDYVQEVNHAINEILLYDLLGIYQKVTKKNFNEMKRKGLTKENEEALKLLRG